jgi:hypothetical protein
MDLFHGIYNRKVISRIPKIPQLIKFYKKPLNFFQNYILVPIILHLGP